MKGTAESAHKQDKAKTNTFFDENISSSSSSISPKLLLLPAVPSKIEQNLEPEKYGTAEKRGNDT